MVKGKKENIRSDIMTNQVMDLSGLGKINRDATRIYLLLDGSRIVAQKIKDTNKDIVVEEPVRVIMRPGPENTIQVELMDYLVAEAPGQKRVEINRTAIVMSYDPDDTILSAYGNHLSKRKSPLEA